MRKGFCAARVEAQHLGRAALEAEVLRVGLEAVKDKGEDYIINISVGCNITPVMD